MKEFGNFENLAGSDLHFIAHPRETAGSNFELRHADRVLVGHAEGELTRHFGEQLAGAIAMAGLHLVEALQARQKLLGIICILIVDEAFDRCCQHAA